MPLRWATVTATSRPARCRSSRRCGGRHAERSRRIKKTFVFTLLAGAFARLPAGTVESLLKPENKQKLVRLLIYHVVPGKVMVADVVKMTSAKAVSGDTIVVTSTGGTVQVDNGTVKTADVAASNSVIHVIDHVMLPKGP